ncbi:MAG: hypothetical protein ACTSUC_05935, partial [Promethearchaeota archaeon]
PTLTIDLPGEDTYWNSRPNVQATATDLNFDSVWYVVDGIKIILENGVSDLLDQGIWDGLMAEETFTIYFYANDSAGNINNSISMTLFKDISGPEITVNDPSEFDVFGVDEPTCSVDFYDINDIDSTWYQLTDGTTSTAIRMWTGSIHVDDWNAMSNGTVTFILFANDTLGNIATENISIYKDIIGPDIIINEPIANDVFGSTQPSCDVTFYDVNGISAMWYQLTDGITTTTIRAWAGSIHLNDWNVMLNGTVTLILFGNDTINNIATKNISVYKDIMAPDITINEPTTSDLFGHAIPECDVIFYDINGIDSMWYQLTDETITTSVREWTGAIDTSDWDAMSNGTVTIIFYANDTVANIATENVSVYRDIIAPDITIYNPLPYELYGVILPTCDIIFYDINGINDTWYQLSDGITTTAVRVWTGSIHVDDWNVIGNGTITLFMFANDTVNNVAATSIDIYKDIIAPTITINDPNDSDVFGFLTPLCSVSFYDVNGISQRWYQISDGITTTVVRSYNGSIHADDWSTMTNGSVILTFFANDTLNNVGISSVSIFKDIVNPIITIYEPQELELFGFTAPNITITIYDPHLDFVLYRLYNGTINTGLIQWLGYIEQSQWDLMGNGTVTIEFIAYDVVNNAASSDIIMRKNIHDPVIMILQPDDGALVGILPPELELYVSSAGLDSIWFYMTDGSIVTDNTNWTGNIDESLWNLFGNGNVYLYFFINDTLGNIGSEIILLLKDIAAPSITINSPDPFEVFGSVPPEILIEFYELNIIDQKWYQLYSPVTTLPVRNWGGNINQNDWDLMPNGTVIIIFFANDSVGNLRSVNISVYKDVIAPSITINSPYEGDLYGFNIPLLFFDVDDPNGISQITYQLTNGTVFTPRFEWNGTIDQYLWAQFRNGTIIIYIYANDTLGNEGFDSIILRKDIIAPSIDVQLPVNYQEIGRESPFFEVYMTDANLATCWYRIMGTNTDNTFTGIYGKVNQTLWENLWDSLSENDTIKIRFYANDTMGNLNYEELTLLKPTSTEEPLPFIFPFDLMEMIPLSLVVGFTVVLSVIIKKSRFYNVSDIKHQKFINRMLILIALLVTLITASVLTQSL